MTSFKCETPFTFDCKKAIFALFNGLLLRGGFVPMFFPFVFLIFSIITNKNFYFNVFISFLNKRFSLLFQSFCVLLSKLIQGFKQCY